MAGHASQVESAERVDRLCDQFESAWTRGDAPSIESYLAAADDADRQPLLTALVGLELELRQQRGERPQVEEYLARFPHVADDVRAAFAEVQSIHSSVKLATAETSKGPAIPVPAATSATQPLTKLGRFQIVTVLGEGAFGTVYKAHDPQLDRDVAIKVPRAGALQNKEDRERFLREARAAAGLQHAQICPVHEVGTIDGRDYIVMAFIDGKPLSKVMQTQARLSDKQIITVIRKLALALQEAHDKGVIHRDLKPANIMINRKGEPVIMDFGLARRSNAGDAQISQSGQIMGTPAYMSPEQARGDGKAVGPAADIYGLGVMLYELLCGRRPFEGTITEVIGQILHVEVKPPSHHRPDVDGRLQDICLKAIAKQPADRFASMKEFAAALADFAKRTSTLQPNAATTESQPAKTDSLPTKQIAQLMEAVSSDLEAKVERAVRTSHQAHKVKVPWWTYLFGSGLMGVIVLFGIIFFLPARTVKVSVTLDVDVDDPQLGFFLDGKNIDRKQLTGEIELTPGKHELIVMKENQVFRRYELHAIRGVDTAEVVVRESAPEPVEKVIVEKTGPRRVDVRELNGNSYTTSPWLSRDGLTIYFETRRPDEITEVGPWISSARRPNAEAPFGDKQSLFPGRHPTVTGDGLELIFIRGQKEGGTLRYARRNSLEEAFTPAGHIAELADQDNVKSPMLYDDGLTLVFQRGRVDQHNIELVYCMRPNRTAPWSRPIKANITPDPTWTEPITWPFQSRDELTLWYCHGGGLAPDIRKATRPDRNSPFDNHERVIVEGTPLIGRAPRFVEATDELFYSPNLTEIQGNWSLWVVKDYMPAQTQPSSSPQPSGDWTDLFNGKDLTGWNVVGPAVWTVRNSAVFVDGQKSGHLVCQQRFEDFELTGEVYAEAKGNGGICFRVSETPADGSLQKGGYEFQVAGSQGDPGGNYTGGLYADSSKVATVNPPVVGDRAWAKIRLLVSGTRLQGWVDDKPTFDVRGQPERLTGQKLTLASFAQGEEVGYRNLRIRPLKSGGSRIPADAQTFNGHAYKFFAETVSWKIAQEKCAALGGHLIIMENAEENAFAAKLVESAKWEDAWIGATDEAKEGDWRTVKGDPLPFANWWDKQPNNKPPGEHWALMSNKKVDDARIGWKWSDQPDESNQHNPGFLCEWDALPPGVVAGNPERAVAEWVLNAGGTVRVALEPALPRTLPECQSLTQLTSISALPDKPFVVVGIVLESNAVTDADLARLDSLARLTLLWLVSDGLSDAGMNHVAGHSGLWQLRATSRNLTDAGIAQLRNLTQLESLDLSYSRLSDDGLKHLAGMKNLRRLELYGTNVSGDGLSALQPLQNLRQLHLSVCARINDDNLRHIAELTGLTSLYLNSTSLTDAGIKHLVKLSALKDLEISETKITGSALDDLATLPELGYLMLNFTSLGDADAAKFPQLKSLRALHLMGTRIGDEGLKPIGTMLNLKHLVLNQTKVTDAGMAHLEPLQKLEMLWLSDNPLTDAAVDSLGKLKSVVHLEIGKTLITPEGRKRLQALIPNTTITPLLGSDRTAAEHLISVGAILGLHGKSGSFRKDDGRTLPDGEFKVAQAGFFDVKSIPLEAIQRMAGLDELTSINLHRCRLPKGALDALAQCPRLTGIDVAECQLTDADLDKVLSNPALRRIAINGNWVGPATFQRLARNQGIHLLNLNHTGLGDDDLKRLCDALELTELHLNGNPLTEAAVKTLIAEQSLKNLYWEVGGKITRDALLEFQRARPDCTLHANLDQPDWIDLFNGKDLTGWKTNGVAEGWAVNNGEIVTEPFQEKPNLGWLMTEQSYDNFELQLEFLTSERTDSGVAFRCDPNETSGAGHAEIQIIDEQDAELVRKMEESPHRRTGALAGHSSLRTLPKLERGVWHTMTLEANGRQLKVTVNGIVTVDTNLNDHLELGKKMNRQGIWQTSGSIGLAKLGQSPVRFRKIRIRPLNPAKNAANIDPDRRAAEWVIRYNTGMVRLTGSGEEVNVDAEAGLPAEPFHLIGLDLWGKPFPPEEIETLRGLKHLARAGFFGCRSIDDRGLAVLGEIPSITSLGVGGNRFTGDGLSELKGLKNLQDLSLNENSNVDDHCLRHLSAFPNLSYLALGHTSITDDGLKQLKHLTKLASVTIERTRITGAALDHLAALPEFSYLNAGYTDLKDDDAPKFAQLKSLVELRIVGTKIGDVGVRSLSEMSRLSRLNLSETRLTNEGLKSVGTMTRLRELWLVNVPAIDDAGIAHLSGLQNLGQFNLSRNNLSDACVEDLGKLKSLTVLTLHQTRITPAGLKRLLQLLPNARIEPKPVENAAGDSAGK